MGDVSIPVGDVPIPAGDVPIPVWERHPDIRKTFLAHADLFPAPLSFRACPYGTLINKNPVRGSQNPEQTNYALERKVIAHYLEAGLSQENYALDN